MMATPWWILVAFVAATPACHRPGKATGIGSTAALASVDQVDGGVPPATDEARTTGTGACPRALVAPEAPARVRERRLIPKGLVGVRFSEPQGIEEQEVSFGDALTLAAKTKEPDRWFFDAFDGDYLHFFSAHYEPNPTTGVRPWGTYTLKRRHRVRRSPESEAALHVDSTVALHEVGTCGIKGGMRKADVERLLGAPPTVQQLGPMGSFDYAYPGLTVRFLNFGVASVWLTSK
jgi:hypothetical protein